MTKDDGTPLTFVDVMHATDRGLKPFRFEQKQIRRRCEINRHDSKLQLRQLPNARDFGTGRYSAQIGTSALALSWLHQSSGWGPTFGWRHIDDDRFLGRSRHHHADWLGVTQIDLYVQVIGPNPHEVTCGGVVDVAEVVA